MVEVGLWRRKQTEKDSIEGARNKEHWKSNQVNKFFWRQKLWTICALKWLYHYQQLSQSLSLIIGYMLSNLRHQSKNNFAEHRDRGNGGVVRQKVCFRQMQFQCAVSCVLCSVFYVQFSRCVLFAMCYVYSVYTCMQCMQWCWLHSNWGRRLLMVCIVHCVTHCEVYSE